MKKPLGHAHWEKTAYVYVRQSTYAQILEHTESTKRQYAFVDRAQALGWDPTRITVIDEDQGKSGATTEGRDGFRRLVDAVVKGDAGAVFALEVSRLSRSSEDWRRLLGLCGVAGVAVCDEQAIYDPSDPDDKLLLDLKGTMSEAELHWLGLRLMGARRQKARRGELEILPPTGYVWSDGALVLDPDESVVRAIQALLDRFRVEPSVWALLRWARAQGQKMPTRRTYADGTTEVVWKSVQASRLYWLLHNPIYAGVYAYGRCAVVDKIVDGNIRRVTRRESDPSKWLVVKQDAHPGYITWTEYLRNQDTMRQNMARMGSRAAIAHAARGRRSTARARVRGASRRTDRGGAQRRRCGHRQRQSVDAVAVKWARRSEGIERSYADRPRRTPLPDRHPDGRYSVHGAVTQLGVSIHQVRGWIKRGLVEATREAYAQYNGVYWIRLDDATFRALLHGRPPQGTRDGKKTAGASE